MAYQKIEKATLDQMLTSFKKFFEDFKKAKTDKAPKDKLKDLETQLKLKSANFGVYVKKLATEAKALYTEHNLKVEDWLNDSTVKVKDLKAAVATLKKSKKVDRFSEVVKYGFQLEDQAKAAKEDSGELAQAWMEVREANFGDKGFQDKDLKPFYDIRTGIISGLKPTGAKLNKLFQLAEEAKLLVNDLRIEFGKGGGVPDVKMLEEDAIELFAELDKSLVDGQDILRKNTEMHGRMKTFLSKPKVEPGDVNFNSSAANEFMKVLKKVQGEAKVMKLKCDQLDKIAQGHDTAVDAQLVNNRSRVTAMDQVFKDCMTLYKAMMVTAEETRKKAAKKK